MKEEREFDIILWGATGFTGSLVARHFVDTYGDELNWAMAGRNLKKLEQVRDQLNDPSIPIIQADSHDQAGMDTLVNRAKSSVPQWGPMPPMEHPLSRHAQKPALTTAI